MQSQQQQVSEKTNHALDGSAGRVVFFSSCPEPWGGSEELWHGAALRLKQSGYYVSACKTLVDDSHPRICELRSAGIEVKDYYRTPSVQLERVRRIVNRALPQRLQLRMGYDTYEACILVTSSGKYDLAVISQGENFDGLTFVRLCQELRLPYVLVSQKASDQSWPPDHIRVMGRDAYLKARRSYFVSQHNRTLTERQFGTNISNSEVVRNPFLTPTMEPLPYPPADDGTFRLACVGRMYVPEKGQDILLRVLAMEKWRARNVEISLYGKGCHAEAIKELATMLSLSNVRFCGFSTNVIDIWRTNHALVLASRAEGVPLVVVEAMLCGRIPIVTNVGGNPEVIEDGVTGFIADGIGVSALDAAMERAWELRESWEAMGVAAAQDIRTHVPLDPCGVFANKLQSVCQSVRMGDAA